MTHDVSKYTHLSQEEKKRLEAIPNPLMKESLLDVNDFISDYRNKQQELTQEEFKRYLPLFNREIGQKLVQQRGAKAIADLSTEFFSKISPYKTTNIINNKAERKVLYTLPAAAVTAPPIHLSEEEERQRALDVAKRKMRQEHSPHIAEQGHREYLALMNKSIKADGAIKHYVHKRLETDALTDNLRKLRDGTQTPQSASQPQPHRSESTSIQIDEDDEVYD